MLFYDFNKIVMFCIIRFYAVIYFFRPSITVFNYGVNPSGKSINLSSDSKRGVRVTKID